MLLTFEPVYEILKCDQSNESNGAVLSVLFCGTVYYAAQGGSVLTFESVCKILKCDHSNESYWAALSCGTGYAVQCGSNFWVGGCNPKLWPFKWKILSSSFLRYYLLLCTRWSSNFSVCGSNPKVWPFKWKLPRSTFLWYCLSCYTRWFQLLNLWMKCDHSHVSHWAVLLCGTSLKCQPSPTPNLCKICLLILILGAKPRGVHSLCRQRACYWRCF